MRDNSDVILIGIAGASASGKTLMANTIVGQISCATALTMLCCAFKHYSCSYPHKACGWSGYFN